MKNALFHLRWLGLFYNARAQVGNHVLDLGGEKTGQQKKPTMLVFFAVSTSPIIGLSLPLGYYIFNLIAYLNRTWTGIHIWVGVVTGLILPMYFLIPESVRWLAQNCKEDEAMDALLRIAKINGKNLSTDDKTKVDTSF